MLVPGDSGGAAEDLPCLGVPLPVYRRRSERNEALESVHARWIDPQAADARDARVEHGLENHRWPSAWPMSVDSPYGYGRAGQGAAAVIGAWFGQPSATGRMQKATTPA